MEIAAGTDQAVPESTNYRAIPGGSQGREADEMKIASLLLILTVSTVVGQESLNICGVNFRPGMTRREVIDLFRLPPDNSWKGLDNEDFINLLGIKFGRDLMDPNCKGYLRMDGKSGEQDRVVVVSKELPPEQLSNELVRTILTETSNMGINEEARAVIASRRRFSVPPMDHSQKWSARIVEFLELRVGRKSILIKLSEMDKGKWGSIELELH